MAKQNSATDPISAAMSAIESALNLTDDDLAAVGTAEKAAPMSPIASAKPAAASPVLKPSAPSAEPTPLLRPSPPPASVGEPEPKPVIPSAPPANDDRETVGAILQAMNARPASRAPFVLAVIGSFAWLVTCVLYGYLKVWPTVSSAPLAETPVPSGSAPSRPGGARPDLLHFRLRRARPPAGRAAPVGARDLAGRSSPGRAGNRWPASTWSLCRRRFAAN